jgi:hypothetical protein
MFAGRNLLRHQLEMGTAIARPELVESLPDRGQEVYRRQRRHAASKRPYTIKYKYPTATITGLACVPVENKTIQSPEPTVTAGGVNHKHVHIYLKPTQSGEWAYQLSISAEGEIPPKQVRIQ